MDNEQPEQQSAEDEAKAHADVLHREKKLIDRRDAHSQPHDGSVTGPHISTPVVPVAPDVPLDRKAPYANNKPPRKHEPQSG